MAWTTMHFAAGMAGAGLLGLGLCAVSRRGWRFLPLGMTAGGLWACVPDMPRIFREDFPSLPLARTLGDKSLEVRLHEMGDVFFGHAMLDAQPREFALHGLILIIAMYNLAILGLMVLEHRQRHTLANRIWRAHGSRGLPGRATPGTRSAQGAVAASDAAFAPSSGASPAGAGSPSPAGADAAG